VKAQKSMIVCSAIVVKKKTKEGEKVFEVQIKPSVKEVCEQIFNLKDVFLEAITHIPTV